MTSWPFMNMKSKRECDEIDEKRKQPDADPNLAYFEKFSSIDEMPET